MKLILENWHQFTEEEADSNDDAKPKKEQSAGTSFRLDDLSEEEKDILYDAFEQSYTKATGESWPKNTFTRRARNWLFFGTVGEKPGVVAVRPQREGGRYKLVAIAGNLRGILQGVSLLQSEIGSSPIWGLVSSDMLSMTERLGLFALHNKTGGRTIIKSIMKIIPASVFGSYNIELEDDGGVSVDVVDIGRVKKYFIANKPYYEQLIEEHGSKVPMLAPALRFALKMVG
jgi:hypothetical protein